jgi:hypothetical protein
MANNPIVSNSQFANNADFTPRGTELTGANSGTVVQHVRLDIGTGSTESQVDGTTGLPVNIIAGSSSGTQYTEGDTDASITGTAVLWEDAADTLAPVSSTKPLPVNIVAGSSSGTEYTEDAAAAANPAGPAVILVRTDTPATQVTTDGDNVAQRGTNYGAAYCQIVTSTGSYVDSFGGGTQYTEDAASAGDPVGNQLIARRRDSLATETTTDGDNTAINSTGKGELYVKHVDAIPVTDNAGSLTVDYATTGSGTATGALRVELPTNGTGVIATVGAVTSITNALPAGTNAIGKLAANSGVDIGDVDVTSIIPGTGATNLGKAEDAAHTTGDVGVMAMSVRQDTAAALSGTDADYQPLITDGSGRLHVNVGNTVTVGSHAVTNAGTFAVQESGAALTALQLIDDSVATTGSAITTKGLAAVGTDGTNARILKTDASGELQVDVLTMPTTTVTGTITANAGSGTFTTSDTATQVDDAAFTPATGRVLMIGATLDDTTPDTVNEGDGGAVRMTADRAMHMSIRDSAGNNRGANVNASNQLSVSVDNTVTVGSHAVTNAGTFAVQESGGALTALQLIDDVVFTDDAAFTPATSKIAMIGAEVDDTGTDSVDEGDAGAVRMSANRNLYVRIRDNAGNERGLNIDANGAASVNGDVAHDAADAGNPIKVGGKAANALPTAVANNDRTNFLTDLFGRQLVGHVDPAMQVWKSANYTTQQTGAVIWDPTAGKKIAITHFTVGAYGTTAGRLILWLGANADATYSAGTDQLVFAGSFAPSTTVKSGAVVCPPTPIFCTTADHELHITTDAALSVDIAVYGYEW